MRKVILTIFYSLLLAKIFAQADSLKQAVRIEPIVFKENIQIKGFNVLDSYKLPDGDLFAVGRPVRQGDEWKGGLRVFYLTKTNNRYRIKFKSEDYQDSYIARPFFFQLDSSRILILIEGGFEYSAGFSGYIKKNQIIKYIGELDIASYIDYHQENILQKTEIYYSSKDYLEFKFSGKVALNPGSDKEKVLNGKKVKYIWNGSKLYYVIIK